VLLSSAQVVAQVEDILNPADAVLLQESCAWRRAAARLTAARPGGICSGLILHQQRSPLKKQAVDHTPTATAPAPVFHVYSTSALGGCVQALLMKERTRKAVYIRLVCLESPGWTSRL
jgi:hypothetical protein